MSASGAASEARRSSKVGFTRATRSASRLKHTWVSCGSSLERQVAHVNGQEIDGVRHDDDVQGREVGALEIHHPRSAQAPDELFHTDVDGGRAPDAPESRADVKPPALAPTSRAVRSRTAHREGVDRGDGLMLPRSGRSTSTHRCVAADESERVVDDQPSTTTRRSAMAGASTSGRARQGGDERDETPGRDLGIEGPPRLGPMGTEPGGPRAAGSTQT